MAELQAAMSSREFGEWMAYASIVPLPEQRADLRIATLAALYAEANRDRKRRRKAYGVGEFCALFSGERAQHAAPLQDPEARKAELWANFRAWAIGCGAEAPTQ